MPPQCSVQPKVIIICGKAGLPVRLQQVGDGLPCDRCKVGQSV